MRRTLLSRRKGSLAAAAALVVLAGCNLGAAPTTYDVGAAFLSGDIDNDGDLDMLAAGPAGDDYVFLDGDGAGGFSEHAFTGSGGVGGQLALIDDDEWPDAIGTSSMSGELRYARGAGTGAFDVGGTIPAPIPDGIYFRSAVADLDGDGRAEVVSVAGDAQMTSLWVYANDGKGNFGTPVAYFIEQFFNSHEVFAGDIDADGDNDVVVAGGGPNGPPGLRLAVFRNDGTGQFSTTMVGPYTGTACGWMDLDEDGHLDVLFDQPGSEGDPGGIRLLAGDGAGGFGAPQPVEVSDNGVCPRGLGDFDGDGHLDIVTTTTDGKIGVWFGDGNLSFSDPHFLGGRYIAADDLDGDSKPDLITTSDEQVEVYLNRLTGRPDH